MDQDWEAVLQKMIDDADALLVGAEDEPRSLALEARHVRLAAVLALAAIRHAQRLSVELHSLDEDLLEQVLSGDC